MKNKRLFKVLLIAITIALLFVAGYTFSKYTSKVSSTGSASIARWAFNASSTDGVNTVNDVRLFDTANPSTLVEGKIAPGTEGDFDIQIDATGSEVGVDYNVKVTSESESPANLKFYVQGDESNKYSSLTALAEAQKLKGTIPANDTNRTRTITVKWKWLYEADSNDANVIATADTADTNFAGGNYTFSMDIIGSQSPIVH